jgi:hypothetical protein
MVNMGQRRYTLGSQPQEKVGQKPVSAQMKSPLSDHYRH